MPTPEETKAAADKAAADAAAATAAADANKATTLTAGQEKPEQWIPEKYHVRKDGKKENPLDVEASMRAVAKAHTELTKKMIDGGIPPESPDAYEIEGPKGFDVAEFRKDPKMADFLKGAHSLGATNKLINYVVNKYLEIAPEIAGAAQELSNEECSAQLGLTWKSEAEMAKHLKGAFLATTRMAESLGMTYDDFDAEFGNKPLFIRAMAKLAEQMGEDIPPVDVPGGGDVTADFDSQLKALQVELDAIPERNTKERVANLAKQTALFEKRYGKGARAPVFANPATKVA